MQTEGFLNHNGDVRNLVVYKVSQQISVLTEIFVRRFLPLSSRTVGQMQQAARSCKQNIVEGSKAAVTSKETEIKLTNVARASLAELEEDYIDYLLFNGLERWVGNHVRLQQLRVYVRTQAFEEEYIQLGQRLPAEDFCNLMITLVKQAQYLLDRMLQVQEQRFLEEGGIREAMSKARREARNNRNGPQDNRK
ncbi:MAG: four helix bundle suffix domain-containing protein [Muribaculaceae bacterium]|nr:four helix bundle suffix domain-containing protein [Muribaculaceae bacterium]